MKTGRVLGMVLGGLGLSALLFAGLYLANQRTDTPVVDTSNTPPIAASLTPVSITAVTELTDDIGPSLRLNGQGEPGATVMLTDRGETVRQVQVGDDGSWLTSLPVSMAPMALEVEQLSAENDAAAQVSIRGVQTVFRIHRAADREAGAPALIMISAPATPSQIVSSPFGGLPGDGPLYLVAIDYDDGGGVIVNGLSEIQGRVRIYVSDSAIGETRVGLDGRWAYIAASVLPIGEYDVRAEFISEDGRSRAAISVPFERLPPLLAEDSDDGALQVGFTPYQWQIRRSLVGGGVQNTVIFRPEDRVADAPIQPLP